jgi:hypothetical protein
MTRARQLTVMLMLLSQLLPGKRPLLLLPHLLLQDYRDCSDRREEVSRQTPLPLLLLVVPWLPAAVPAALLLLLPF